MLDPASCELAPASGTSSVVSSVPQPAARSARNAQGASRAKRIGAGELHTSDPPKMPASRDPALKNPRTALNYRRGAERKRSRGEARAVEEDGVDLSRQRRRRCTAVRTHARASVD